MSRACFICQRESFSHLTYKGTKTVCGEHAAHAGCAETYMQLTDLETEALTNGGKLAGRYLDEVGKTDMADLSAEQWRTFLAKVMQGYGDTMIDAAKAEPPF